MYDRPRNSTKPSKQESDTKFPVTSLSLLKEEDLYSIRSQCIPFGLVDYISVSQY